MKGNNILLLYQTLLKKHGTPKGQWNLWCKRPKTRAEREIVVIQSILTQNTNWQNVEKSMAQLKKVKLITLNSIVEMAERDLSQLAEIIRPAGFMNSKAKYLLNISNYFIAQGGIVKAMKRDLSELRQDLLKIKGIGPETCDSILNYALDLPSFVIDEYTRRTVEKYKISKKTDYNELQRLFVKNIKRDYALYQDLHALIVIDNKLK